MFLELSGTNSNWDSEEKKKFIKKKKNKSFPKNLRDFMTRSDNNSQTNGSNNNNNDNTVQNKRGSNPVKWDDLYDYDSSNRMNNHHDILEEEEEDEEEEELIPRLPRVSISYFKMIKQFKYYDVSFLVIGQKDGRYHCWD